MIGSRFPPEDATSFAKPQTVELKSGEEATITWTPERSGSTFYLLTLAISKASDTSYEIKRDGKTIYGPAAIPPTDIDDLKAIWDPPKEFEDNLEAIIGNLGTATRIYHAQPVGFETVEGVE